MSGFRWSSSLLVLGFLACASGYSSFRDQIPNGNNVPHPCINGVIWEGVGHENPKGSGTRNSFGKDFSANGFKWDATLCRKDSDGDGRTNGQELGDPDCVWTQGSQPTYTSDITHPGVCEPLGSDQCRGQVSFVFCSGTSEFDCPVTREAGTFPFESRFPVTPVPAKETTYICMVFEFPVDQEYHIVATEAIVDNRQVMHHTLVFGCEDKTTPPHPLGSTKECGSEMDSCREIIGLWGPGTDGSCFDENMGFLVGGNSGYRYAIIQHHWNNPFLAEDQTDSSGFKFYLTPNLRPYNAGLLMIGQGYLAIPPNAAGHVVTGSCTEQCTPQIMSGNINVVSTINHMHLLGKAQLTELRRNGTRLMYIARDDVYDYNAPIIHTYDEPIVIRPGDEIKTTCVFQSRDRDMTTNFGEATSDEMCLVFITYYPKENLQIGYCTAWKSLDFCELYLQNVKRGCDFERLANYNDSYTKEIVDAVSTLCTPFECRTECLNYVRRLKQAPCYSGDVGDLVRTYAMDGDPSTRSDVLEWYSKFDSCDWELWSDGYTKDGEIVASAGLSRVPVGLTLTCLMSLAAYVF